METLGATGYTFAFTQGLSLRQLRNRHVYTIDMFFNLDPICTGEYCKLVDFNNLTSGRGVSVDTVNLLGFYGTPNRGIGQVSSLPVQVNRNASGVFSAYLNGVIQFSFNESSNLAVFSGPSNIIYLFQDQSSVQTQNEQTKRIC